MKALSLSDAVREFADEPDPGRRLVLLDAFLFPFEYDQGRPLVAHGRRIFRERALRKYLWIEGPRGSAKTLYTARANVVLKVLDLLKILYSGPSYRQSKTIIGWERKLIYSGGPFLRDILTQDTSSSEKSILAFSNGSESVALPASGPMIHGERGDDLILTEFAYYPEDLFGEAVLPMLAAGSPNATGRVVYETAAGHQNSFAYEWRKQILDEVTKGNPDYGFVHYTVEDLRTEGFQFRENIVEQGRRFGEDVYQQMYMTVWRSAAGNFYPWKLLHSGRLKQTAILWERRDGKLYAAGLDVGWSESKQGADSAIAVWEVTPTIGVPPALVFASAWHGLRGDRLVEQIANVLTRYDVSRLVIDIQGAGVNIYETLKQQHGLIDVNDPGTLPGRRIQFPFPHTPTIINECHGLFKGALGTDDEQPQVWFPRNPENEDPRIIEAYETINRGLDQFADLQTRLLPSGYYKFEAPAHKKRDIAMAILYGHYAARMLMPQPEPPKRERGSPVIEAREFAHAFSPIVDPRYDVL